MLNFCGYTLFLDRDGVLNKRLVGDYVLSYQQFEFIEGTQEAIKIFNSVFNYVFVVTNQQGIGKKLMTENDLTLLHSAMKSEIEKNGGHIDDIFYCPALESDNSFLRKPNIGMALNAKQKYPLIRFKQSVMVGDSISDMLFGKRAGMKTVFIDSSKRLTPQNTHLIDYRFSSLFEFAKNLTLK